MADHKRQSALEIERRENTNLRILEWMHNLEAAEKEAQSTIRRICKTENLLFGWTATDRPLEIPPDNLSHVPSTWTSINNFVRGVGVGFTHIDNLMIKKVREVRDANGLELDQEGTEPTIGRIFVIKFEISNEYSDNILITERQ